MKLHRLLTLIPPRWVFLGGMLLVAASLPLSEIGMSIGQFMMAWGWLFSTNLKERAAKLLRSRLAWVLVSLYLLHVVFLINTSDFNWALKDLRIKLPLLLMPVLLLSAPRIDLKEIRLVLFTFIAAVFSGSIISTWLALVDGVSDPRQLSLFISHIRFSLEVCLAIAFMVIMAFKAKTPFSFVLFIALALWFLIFLFILRSFTGLLIFALVLWIGSLYGAFVSHRYFTSFAWVFIFTLLSLGYGLGFNYLKSNFFIKKAIDPVSLQVFTPDGNPYNHDTLNTQTIHGNYVWLFVCETEMRDEWNRRATISYDSVAHDGQPVRDLLIRYLTSKGLHKDAQAVRMLNTVEIDEISHGKAFAGKGIRGQIAERISDVNWSIDLYHRTGDASGNSLTQRFELWKTGLYLVRQNPVFGVGTGDVKREFSKALTDNKSSLAGSPLRAHNQWLTFGIAFGFVGLILAFLIFIYPLFFARGFKSPMYFLFFLIIVLSMMAEDTLETQAGVTLLAFFNVLVLAFPGLDPHLKNHSKP